MHSWQGCSAKQAPCNEQILEAATYTKLFIRSVFEGFVLEGGKDVRNWTRVCPCPYGCRSRLVTVLAL